MATESRDLASVAPAIRLPADTPAAQRTLATTHLPALNTAAILGHPSTPCELSADLHADRLSAVNSAVNSKSVDAEVVKNLPIRAGRETP